MVYADMNSVSHRGGKNNYGLYILAASIISMFTFDFGMSTAVTRFVSKYNAERDQQSVNNFLGIVYKLYFLISGIVSVLLIRPVRELKK